MLQKDVGSSTSASTSSMMRLTFPSDSGSNFRMVVPASSQISALVLKGVPPGSTVQFCLRACARIGNTGTLSHGCDSGRSSVLAQRPPATPRLGPNPSPHRAGGAAPVGGVAGTMDKTTLVYRLDRSISPVYPRFRIESSRSCISCALRRGSKVICSKISLGEIRISFVSKSYPSGHTTSARISSSCSKNTRLRNCSIARLLGWQKTFGPFAATTLVISCNKSSWGIYLTAPT